MSETLIDSPLYGDIYQERFNWYQVNNLLHDLTAAAKDLSLSPEDIVHLGGTALYYRCYQVFGPKTVYWFRGTRDMDLLSFRAGTVKQVLDRLTYIPTSTIESYSLKDSFGLPNKKKATVNFRAGNDTALKLRFGIDIYESHFGKIRFNQREMTAKGIIFDPPEALTIPSYTGLVSAPSIRDSFVIKMDILDFSLEGLRAKDQLDVLMTLNICGETSYKFELLLEAIINSSSQHSTIIKLRSLETLFDAVLKDRNAVEAGANPFLPAVTLIRAALQDVKRYQDHVSEWFKEDETAIDNS